MGLFVVPPRRRPAYAKFFPNGIRQPVHLWAKTRPLQRD
jgi:hypothetical protein